MTESSRLNYCPFCGHPLPKLNRYCNQCGANIANSALSTGAVQHENFAHTPEMMKSPESQISDSPIAARHFFSWKWLVMALTGLFFLVVFILAIRWARGFLANDRAAVVEETPPAKQTEAVDNGPSQNSTSTQEAIDPTSIPKPLPATGIPTSLPTPTESAPTAPGTRVRTQDEMVQVYIPAGEFLMGSDDGDTDERPTRKVYVDSFWIDQTEVTTAQYQRCVSEKGCFVPEQFSSATRHSYYLTDGYENYPVVFVNWRSANAYCSWAGGRLPGEAEWEKAARGTDGRIFPWGNAAPDSSLMNFDNQVGDTTPVGSYPAGVSPYGVFDMSGNVWEWIGDMFNAQYMGHRGGSWDFGAFAARSANRGGDNADSAYYNLGFRCANSE